MDNKDLKALNEKLLKFAGFTDIKDAKFSSGWHSATFPDNSDLKGFHSPSPNLVEDANHQIRWLYPKLREQHFDIHNQYTEHGFSTIIYHGLKATGYIFADTPQLAFALAVEKLINHATKTYTKD